MTHDMVAKICEDEGKVTYTCSQCDRVMEFYRNGTLRILVKGDQMARHQGSTLPGLQFGYVEIEYDSEPRKVH